MSSVVPRNRYRVALDSVDDIGPRVSFASIPQANRTYHYWHVFVPGVKAGANLWLSN